MNLRCVAVSWSLVGIVALTVLAWPMTFARAADDPRALFNDAVKAYHQADYPGAVALNEKILAAGYSSAALYYNLGNAHLKAGHLGKALLSYRRAQHLAPRDGDLKANLDFARSLVENYQPWPQRSWTSPAQRIFTDRELPWLAFAVAAIAGIVLLAGLYAGLPRKRLLLPTIIMSVLAAYLTVASANKLVADSRAAVAVLKAEARFEPSQDATVYFKVPEGTELMVLRSKDNWQKIERADGKTGWVPGTAVERVMVRR